MTGLQSHARGDAAPVADDIAGDAAGAALRAGSRVTPLANGATASWLDGGRLFLQHGPINLIVRAGGSAPAVEAAYRALIREFPDWLGALVEELPRLRSPESPRLALPASPIARRMVAAVRACAGAFVTPMAAVAGSVADEAAAVLAAQPGIQHAYVNNGGDIALHLEPGARLSVGVVPTLREAIPRARIEIVSDSAVRGIATSGWQGRSLSLGIADAVTVLARGAALADAAATLVANAVDVITPASAASRPARSTRTATSGTCRSRWRCPHWTRVRPTPRSRPDCNAPARCAPEASSKGRRFPCRDAGGCSKTREPVCPIKEARSPVVGLAQRNPT